MGPAAPDGQVFNPNPANFGGAHFIFATEDGTVSSWKGGTNAVLNFDNSKSGAVYKGLALAQNGGKSFLYATNFRAGTVDVLDSNFNKVTLGGSFSDPSLPAGYAPFNITAFNGWLYVTYALQNASKHDDVAGPGHGFVDVFDTNGNLLQRLISMGTLNSPWGMAWAPSGFGPFTGDLLVGTATARSMSSIPTTGPGLPNWMITVATPPLTMASGTFPSEMAAMQEAKTSCISPQDSIMKPTDCLAHWRPYPSPELSPCWVVDSQA